MKKFLENKNMDILPNHTTTKTRKKHRTLKKPKKSNQNKQD
ncbi:hypothetical protein [Methanosphaera sp. BMS]|nr:hypothetical protein [Methanosphaera sp. BMS]